MKKIFACVFFLVSTAAFANNRAFLISDKECLMADGSGGDVWAQSNRVIVTNSSNGTQIQKCFAKGVPNDTGRAVYWDRANLFPLLVPYPYSDVYCVTENGRITYQFNIVVSASGNAVMTCIFKRPDPVPL